MGNMDTIQFCLSVLLLSSIKAESDSNDSLIETQRVPRVSGRIVKVYSGNRPEPYLCNSEGYKADPHSCASFYRCVKERSGKFNVFRYQCAPGTVYDPDIETCNHPRNTRRTECGGVMNPVAEIIDTTLANDIYYTQKEIPRPISNDFASKRTTIEYTSGWTASTQNVQSTKKTTEPIRPSPITFAFSTPDSSKYMPEYNAIISPWESSTLGSLPIITSLPKLTSNSDDICNGDGFTGDNENCRKFYRCVANQRGGYLRYEFFCSESTVWDEAVQSCNHPWAVKRSKCGRSLTLTEKSSTTVPASSQTSTHQATQIDAEYGQKINKTSQQQLQVGYGSKVTQTQTQISHSNEVIQNQTQIAHGSAVSQTQTQIDYGNEGFQTQVQIDHTKNSSQSQTQIHDITTTRSSTSQQEFTNTNTCSESGFIGDPNDCKKFYRCVDNGRGTFTKYEYSCGDGTAWDQSIEACNHAWAVKECGSQSDNGPQTTSTMKSTTYNAVTSNTQKTSSQSNYYSSTSETPEINDIDIGYGSPASSDILSESTTSLTTTSVSSSKVENTDCSSTGFIGDANDCKKFYRCVENSRGVFTKHEFKCGEGTVWDPDIEACNHEWAVKNCGGNSHKDETTTTKNESASTSAVHTTVTLIQTTTQLSSTIIDDYDTGYGIQNPQTTSESVKTTKELQYETTEATQNPISNNDCKYSGFMGDASNCKKFYRCVNNGMGGYTKYEFSCGEGTLWDPSIEACNHAWAVEKCGGISNTTESNTEITSEIYTKPANLETTTTKTTIVDKNTDEPVHTSTTSSTSTSSASEPNVDNICNHSGFMGNNSNCKIFYRCVDNGDGSFTRYDFTCGEGTVWDPKIEACNHEWAVQKCGSTMESTTSSYTSTSQYPTLQDNIKDDEPTTQSHEISSTTQSFTTTVGNNNSISNQKCSRDGFVGDKNDCKKFYRCVDNGNGEYDRYEFYCGEGTVWDESILSCNHAWAVKECGANDNTPQTNNENTSASSLTTTETKDTTIHSTEKSTSITGNPSENEVNDGECKNEGFFGNVVDCKKFYRCVDDGKGGFTKYEFSCGEGTTWNTNIQACDHPASDRPCGQIIQSTTQETHFNDEMISETTTNLTPSTSTSSTSESSNETQKPQSSGKCESEGFYGNPSNCKQFFRCVSDDKGGYTKYDFTCGDGTVWNQEIQACDHESDDVQCLNSGSGPAEDGASQQQSTTSSSQLESSTGFSSTTDRLPQTDKTTTTTDELSALPDDKCTAEGFFAHPNDCKKFVRCVSNGNGEYTRYEFSCGEGTVWVQEIQACDHDNGIKNCSQQNESTIKPEDNSSSSTSFSSTTEPSHSSTESQTQKEDNVYATSKKPSNTETDKCTSEGYFANKNDCRKFYRCVDDGNGSYTKHNFDCGEGTAWDSNIQTCNHMSEVESCSDKNREEIYTQQTMKDDEVSQTTEGLTSTTKGTTLSGSGLTEESGSSDESGSGSNDSCTSEGYFGDSKDCKKFYRCVDDGSGGLTKYEFNCGDGTIWDQDITTCNHPQDVTNPSCKSEGGGGGGEENSQIDSSSSTSTTQSSPPSSGSTESSSQSSSNCSQEDSSKKPASSKDITCEKAGYYANPNDCKKFYRCVDWDGDGQRFSVYHFECGEGTIWDPALDTCNHEESVYPPRDCSQTQTHTESSSSKETTTQKQDNSTTQESTTSEQTTYASTTSEQTTTQREQNTTQESTTNEMTTQQSTTNEQTTVRQSTTSDQTTTQQSTTSELTTQQSTTSEQSTAQETTTNEQTTQQFTTSQQTTTEQSTTSEQTTTQQSTTSEETTTQQSTTIEQTTLESATSEQTTQKTTTSEQTTEQTTEQASTQESTTSEHSTTQASQTTTEQVTDQTSEHTESSTTEGTTESSTTEQSSSTSEGDQESTTQPSSDKECPETENDQNLFVCPTSFKRHPKYCNMFYQCTEDDDTHDVKIATFKCPNETSYDESQTQCVEEKKADKKCTGEMARRHRFKRLHRDSQEPITVANKLSCPAVGYYSLEKNIECSNGFLKCEISKSGKLRGYIHQCPEGYLFWSISKRCELGRKIRDCKRSSNDWKNRWNIPIDRKNVAL